jgi:hypothetical protein
MPVPRFWVEPLTTWEEHARQAGFAVTTRRLRGRYLAAVARTVPDPWTATTSVLEAALAAARLAPSSTFDARGALRAFYAWALAAGRVSVDPAREMTCAPRRPEAAPAPRVEPGEARPGPGRAPQLPPAWAAAVREWAVYVGASGLTADGADAPALPGPRRPDGRPGSVVGDDGAAAALRRYRGLVAGDPQVRPGGAAGVLRVGGGDGARDGRSVPASAGGAGGPGRAAPCPRRGDRGSTQAGGHGQGTADDRPGRPRRAARHGDRRGAHRSRRGGPAAGVRQGDQAAPGAIAPVPAGAVDRPAAWLCSSRGRGGHITAAYVGRSSAICSPTAGQHTLRHACGTALYEATGDPFVVKEILGHAKLDTSLGYTRVPGERLRAAIAARHVIPVPTTSTPGTKTRKRGERGQGQVEIPTLGTSRATGGRMSPAPTGPELSTAGRREREDTPRGAYPPIWGQSAPPGGGGAGERERTGRGCPCPPQAGKNGHHGRPGAAYGEPSASQLQILHHAR